MPIDKSKITRDMIQRAKQSETADELIALAKTVGFDITKEEAEAYLDELEDFELDSKELDKVAGGESCYSVCHKNTCPLFGI